MPIYRRTDRHRPPLSKQQKLDLFRDCTVVHPHLKKAYEEFRDAISNPGGASIIFLFGPTGVGKTTLLQQISKVMLEEHCSRMDKDSDYLPVATAEAIEGEQALQFESGELTLLRQKLGLSGVSSSVLPTNNPSPGLRNTQKRKYKPGVRQPNRDVIGET